MKSGEFEAIRYTDCVLLYTVDCEVAIRGLLSNDAVDAVDAAVTVLLSCHPYRECCEPTTTEDTEDIDGNPRTPYTPRHLTRRVLPFLLNLTHITTNKQNPRPRHL